MDNTLTPSDEAGEQTESPTLPAPPSPPDQGTSTADIVRLDPVRQRQAIALAREQRRALSIFSVACGLIVAGLILFMLLSPLPSALLSALVTFLLTTPALTWQPVMGWSPLLALVVCVLVSAVLLLIWLPLAWLLYFFVPRRYGWHREITALKWLRIRSMALLIRYVKAWLLIELATLLIAVQPRTWWVWAALVQFLFSVLMARLVPLWLLRLNRRSPALNEEVYGRFRALLDRLHLPSCHLYVSRRSGTARASCIGWGKARSIILSDTLVEQFTLDEIEVILAHELAHHVHHDIWKQIIVRSLTFLLAFLLIGLLLPWLPALHKVLSHLAFDDVSLFLLLFGDIVLLLIWCLTYGYLLLTRRYNRYREYRADEFALQMTGNALAFKNSMVRLANLNMSVVAPTRQTRYASTHPPLGERLKHADEFAARQLH